MTDRDKTYLYCVMSNRDRIYRKVKIKQRTTKIDYPIYQYIGKENESGVIPLLRNRCGHAQYFFQDKYYH